MTSPRRARRASGDGGAAGEALAGAANLRGALLIGVAVVVGVLLLGKGFDSGFLPSANGDPSDEVATGDDEGDGEASTTTAPPTTHVPAEVRVQVLNGGAPPGSAGATSTAVSGAGYVALGAADTADVAASVVYSTAGFEADAQAIATLLGIAAAPQPLPTPPPSGAPADASVVIVLGPDFTPPG